MNLKRVKEILETAKLDETHVKALDEFFTQYTEEVRKTERKNLGANSSDEMISKKVAEATFNKLKEDSEKAFNLFKEDSKQAFKLFKEDSEKAFELYAEDLQNEYTENMIKGLQDLYSDVEERVKKDFMESKDYSILEGVKRMVMPLIAAEEQKALLEEIEKLKEEKNKILSINEDISKENIISSLVSGFPQEYSESIKSYLNSSKTTDEIYERFSFICEMVDKGIYKPEKNEIINEEKKVVKKKVEPKVEPKKEIKQKKIITEELNKGTVKSKTVENKKHNDFFTDEDDRLISMMFN
jgi:hypothetical protein